MTVIAWLTEATWPACMNVRCPKGDLASLCDQANLRWNRSELPPSLGRPPRPIAKDRHRGVHGAHCCLHHFSWLLIIKDQ
ncbi:MAG: hypothetical protein LC721_00210 [Actinobacteria bacterium]|nr:hypothetical protein [Actinomycetota bacterium]